MSDNPPNPAVTVTQAMRRARVSQALRAIEEGTRLDDLTDDEIDTIIDAARDHRQSNPVAAGGGEGLREARLAFLAGWWVNAATPGEDGAADHDYFDACELADWKAYSATLSTPPEDLHTRDALLLGGDAMPEGEAHSPAPMAGGVRTFVQHLRNRADSRDCMGYDATADQIRQAADLIERLAAHPSTQEGGK